MKTEKRSELCLCRREREMQPQPDADSFVQARKKGNLLKLVGRGWFSSGNWKKRFCVLDGTKLYYYENEKSSGTDKTSGVISLDYYDVCEQFDARDKKNEHVFIVGTSVRGFFDNNHQFAVETSREMQDWIRSVHEVIADARNIRSRAGRNKVGSDKVSPVPGNKVVVLAEMSSDAGDDDLNIEGDQPALLLSGTNKDRVRGPQGRRLPQRKSMMPTGSPNEDGLKPRSFSLSSPKEKQEEENEEETSDQRRISLSMEAVYREGNAQDSTCQRSSFSSDQLSPPGAEAGQPRKPIFSRLGGQHSALTKELEFKLKSGLAPGGRRFHPHKSDESDDSATYKSRTGSEAEELERKVEAIDIKMGTVDNSVRGLEESFATLKQSVASETQSLVQDLLAETQSVLKEVQQQCTESKEVLIESRMMRDEHRQLMQECQEILEQLKKAQSST